MTTKIPDSESGASLKIITATGNQYIISQNPFAAASKRFTLWAVQGKSFVKIKQDCSPTLLRVLAV